MYRHNHREAAYKNHTQTTGEHGCPFCNLKSPILNPTPRKIAQETAHAVVIDNLFGYDIWEGYKVTEHLMVIPKRHVWTLSQLTKTERLEIMDLYCAYEANGYNVYSRAPQSGMRSHVHVHTHFIKIEGQKAAQIAFTNEPYTLTIEW